MSKRATKTELEEQYTLDDVLKLSALCQMQADTMAGKADKLAKETDKRPRGRRR